MKDMDTPAGSRTCDVRDVPEEVEAGAEVTLRIELAEEIEPAETERRAPARFAVAIVASDGTEVATAPLAPAQEAEGHLQATGEVVLRAPDRPGPHRFVARISESADEAGTRPAAETEFQLAVVAHRIAPVVWDVPQAVEPGADFTVKVGARCASQCDATGWSVSIRDDNGDIVATAKVGDAVWPGTEALRYAEISLTAPEEIGRFAREAVVEAPEAALPHEAGRRRFGLRTAPKADARLLVEAVDAETGEPASGLKVVAGPFFTRTGADGTAELAVPRGAHGVFVSGGHYLPQRVECVVEDVETVRVALEPDTGLTYEMIWG